MKPIKLKSGNWNVRAYLGKDENGKSIIRSVTATTRKEAVEKALELERKARGGDEMRVGSAVKDFIDARKPVLSPNTIRAYTSMYENYIKTGSLSILPIAYLTDSHVQNWINKLVQSGLSAKSVRNTYGLLSAALTYRNKRLIFNVRLPQRQRPKLYTPSTKEVQAIVKAARDINFELYKAILLGAVGMMRRGEICALTADDVDFEKNTIAITKAAALDVNNKIVIKPPKNEASNRVVVLPDFVIREMPKTGRLVDMTPNAVTIAFRKLLAHIGAKPFRFHDLRHYAASIAASSSVGASIEAIKARGGWATDGMMKRIYINQIGDEIDKDTMAINDYYKKNL